MPGPLLALPLLLLLLLLLPGSAGHTASLSSFKRNPAPMCVELCAVLLLLLIMARVGLLQLTSAQYVPLLL
jgi:hypothetical protein